MASGARGCFHSVVAGGRHMYAHLVRRRGRKVRGSGVEGMYRHQGDGGGRRYVWQQVQCGEGGGAHAARMQVPFDAHVDARHSRPEARDADAPR